MIMPKLDEATRRRPEFTPGTPIVLCDGQAWQFPTPTVHCYYPARGKGGQTVLVEGYDFGDEYDRLTDEYSETDDDDFVTQIRVLTDLAVHLLSRNYTLTFPDLRHLLRVEVQGDTAANRAMWSAISAAALGKAPKPSAVGDATA